MQLTFRFVKSKLFIAIFLLSILFVVLAIHYCNKKIEDVAKGNLYWETDKIPFNKVGLLLGTGKFLSNGKTNPYYKNRIEAALTLYNAGKIKYIIISGDNSRDNYNEPEEMKRDLMSGGMDSVKIFLDYAGFRTFDSIIRLKNIFGQSSATIISQSFHNERAIYIASKEGISAVGFNSKDVDKTFGIRVQIREKLARVKVFLDYLLGQKPKFLGEKVVVP